MKSHSKAPYHRSQAALEKDMRKILRRIIDAASPENRAAMAKLLQEYEAANWRVDLLFFYDIIARCKS